MTVYLMLKFYSAMQLKFLHISEDYHCSVQYACYLLDNLQINLSDDIYVWFIDEFL